MRLGKQARDDGAFDSDNVLGDMVESLIGALWLEAGFETAKAFIRSAWGDRVEPPRQRAASTPNRRSRNGRRRTTARRRPMR